MKLRLTPKNLVFLKITAYFTLLYFGLVIVSNLIFGEDSPIYQNPHSLLEKKEKCPSCHSGTIERNGQNEYRVVNFTKDVHSLCTTCHSPEIHHPVDISPGAGYAGRLPLDPDGEMSCTTCHNPHGKPFADEPFVGRSVASRLFDLTFPFVKRKYRTYYLREKNLKGELCLECHSMENLLKEKELDYPNPSDYVTSRVCKNCHPYEFSLWRKSPHALMVRSPRKENFEEYPPDTIDAGIKPEEVVFVLGSHWVNRFVSARGDTLVVRKPIWIISSKEWNFSYWREFDWVKSCAGCHVTGLNPETKMFAETGIACEACHGPGKKHSKSRSPTDIVNPGKLPEDLALMICESCHTTGHDRTGEYRYPAGYLPGYDLSKFFFGLRPKPGQDDSTFKNDGSIEDRHRQFRFWLERYLFTSKETCDLCKNFRFRTRDKKRKETVRRYCLTCHGERYRAPSDCVENSRDCVFCHRAPRNDEGKFTIHDHKYVPENVFAKIVGSQGGDQR